MRSMDLQLMSDSGRKAWLKSGEYLPEMLQDFHDQKDLFKAIHEQYRLHESQGHSDVPIDWVQAQIYTVDRFLWFMAEHGYTLQRSRKRVPFCDLDATVQHRKKIRDEAMAKAMGLTPISAGDSQS